MHKYIHIYARTANITCKYLYIYLYLLPNIYDSRNEFMIPFKLNAIIQSIFILSWNRNEIHLVQNQKKGRRVYFMCAFFVGNVLENFQ